MHKNKLMLFYESRIVKLTVVVKGCKTNFSRIFIHGIYLQILPRVIYRNHKTWRMPRLGLVHGCCCFMYSAATTVKVGKTMFSERLREARKAKHYSQAEVSRLLGVTQQAVGKWETGRSTPDPQTVARLAEILDTTADMLLGLQSNADAHGAVGQRAFSQYTQCPIPVVGTVRAGYDALAFEEDYGTEYASVKDPQNYFYLVVKGDSMEPRISDGDLALIHRQNTLDNGDLGVMVYGDGNGTLKKYIQRGNAVVLHPFNPDYEDLIIRGEELDHLYIAGKVVETKAKW